METKLKYFIYCRKSEENEDKQILSIEAQLRELKEYAQRCNLRIAETFTESKSAHKPGREKFDDMLLRIESGEANGMLVWHANRIARNMLDGGRVMWFMDKGKIIQIDTPSKTYKNTPDDKFYLGLEFSMAKKSSDDLSVVIKRGNRQKYERGEYIGVAPIGYINIKLNGHPTIAPDPEKAFLIKKLFEEYATGKCSLGQMCELIASWGLRTQTGKRMVKSHLHRVLQKEVYYGWFRHGGELHKGSYEALITKQLYDEVQDVLHNRSKPRKTHNDWAYAGLIKCGCDCGASIIFETKKKYYKGTDRNAEYTYARSSKRCGTCLEKGTTLERIEQKFIEKVSNIEIDKEQWQLGIELLEAKYEGVAKERANIVVNLQREYQKLQNELDGYFKMRAKEEMTAEEFQNKKTAITKEQARLQEKIDEGVHNQRHWLELAEDFINTAFYARKILEEGNLEEKREIIKKVGWNLLLKDGELVWTFQKPYDILLKPGYRSNMSRGRDSNPRRPKPADLQSAPVDRLGTPGVVYIIAF